jgi:hypothetical protein
VNIALKYKWIPIENQPGVRYQFPENISSHFRANWDGPAVYRWLVLHQEPGHLRQLYIGETELLPRRIYGYLNPGPSQRTNQRLKAKFEEELRNGYKVTLEVLSFDSFSFESISISMDDLTDKVVRRFLESLFTMYYSKSGYTVLNA